MGSEENSQIRIEALLKELDRQQLEVKKKKTLIRGISVGLILVSLVTFSLVYKSSKFDKSQFIQTERNVGEIVKEKKIVPKQVKSFQLVFENINQYPLARFFSEKEALTFQNEIKNLHLPKTKIIVDSLKGKERVLAISSNYRYYIQFGIFKKKLLSSLPDNMIYLHQLRDKELFKYRLGPFAKSTQAEKFINDINLTDYLIVEVSN